LIVRSDRSAHPPYGLQGGAPGTLSSNLLERPDGTTETLPSMFSTTIAEGEVYVHRMAGGGGWGDPLTRDPARVAADVLDGKVTPAGALGGYGVAIGADGTIDEEATRRERNARN
jgi:N-methylhydantoinase B